MKTITKSLEKRIRRDINYSVMGFGNENRKLLIKQKQNHIEILKIQIDELKKIILINEKANPSK